MENRMTEQLVLVTGAAGFIGFHVSWRLLQTGWRVVGVDNLNDYYDQDLKKARLAILEQDASFQFAKVDIADRSAIAGLFARYRFPRVIHLAAQAGVRYSIENPHAYIDANLTGFANILEGCRHQGCGHLMYASSSSVYGANGRVPFAARDNVDHPISLYAATKKANELMAHAYSHLYQLPATGLRFFTVYGPWGRPDMAMYLFSKAIISDEPIKLFNSGKMRRDFTYIDDLSETVLRLLDRPPQGDLEWSAVDPNPATSSAPWKIYNIGNGNPEELLHVVELLEKQFGKTARKELCPMQPGDVAVTYADTSELVRAIGFRPTTGVDEGVAKFTDWFRSYHRC
jgi:UDP-glucuronate 4-epimerase